MYIYIYTHTEDKEGREYNIEENPYILLPKSTYYRRIIFYEKLKKSYHYISACEYPLSSIW